MKEISVAKCCGSCKHASRPKTPQDHAPHYSVAKTERWCYRHNQHITREAVCDDYELETKKGASSSIKRVINFNKKLEKVDEVKQFMIHNNISELVYKGSYTMCHYRIINNQLLQCSYIMNNSYSGPGDLDKLENWKYIYTKSGSDVERLLEAYHAYIKTL